MFNYENIVLLIDIIYKYSFKIIYDDLRIKENFILWKIIIKFILFLFPKIKNIFS